MSTNSKTFLINLISSNGSNVGKALRLGRKFLGAGWQVVLSINIEAVKILDPSVGQEHCPVAGKPLLEMVKAFQNEGGQVLVGTECLALAEMGQDVLLPGMKMATFPLMEEILDRPEVRTMTW